MQILALKCFFLTQIDHFTSHYSSNIAFLIFSVPSFIQILKLITRLSALCALSLSSIIQADQANWAVQAGQAAIRNTPSGILDHAQLPSLDSYNKNSWSLDFLDHAQLSSLDSYIMFDVWKPSTVSTYVYTFLSGSIKFVSLSVSRMKWILFFMRTLIVNFPNCFDCVFVSHFYFSIVISITFYDIYEEHKCNVFIWKS